MTTLTAFYDLKYGPISYDFCTWLVRAMYEQKERGCDKLHVVIVPYEEGLGGFARHWGEHDEYATYWRLWHIVVASCPLARATVTVAFDRNFAHYVHGEVISEYDANLLWWPEGKAHFMAPLVDAAKSGKEIPKLRATNQARRYVAEWDHEDLPVVTLTIRNQSTDAVRNSNDKAWDRLVDWLLDIGYFVYELDDTHERLQTSTGCHAVIDTDIRMALYESAYMNIIGANGPSVLMHLSDVPYINIGIQEGWREHYRKYFHMEFGEQFPWAKPNQRIIYKPDTFENMREACETYLK